jgi:putative pyruvate formate lyase activating enzyme
MNSVKRYTDLFKSGELDKRIEALETIALSCTLCPWECKVNRRRGEKGVCKAGSHLTVSKWLSHFGEEPVITGSHGSGTVFFTHCNLKCSFCQNYQISQEHLGSPYSADKLAETMLSLQEQGCHNINLVSPTHFLPQILNALKIAAAHGLTLPIVYNSNGYEKRSVLKILDGIIDIYLPDAKYGDDRWAKRLSKANHYTHYNRTTLIEMYRQVGNLILNQEGIAQRGLIIRHLVLPDDCAQSEMVLKTIKEHLGTEVHISLMAQYFPTFCASRYPPINRKLTPSEYHRSLSLLKNLGFENGWCQEPEGIKETFIPDFTKKESWN